jgi:tetrahydromethanopterin S-methyltransferase subunit A
MPNSNSGNWPVAEGRYKTGNPESPVAVCTMASVDMDFPMDKIAITGKCVTENLGVEKIIQNTISNPSIRYIIFCGKESQGHFVGQAVKSLKDNGVDGDKRIIGAKGGMPILKNLQSEDIERFRQQVEPIDMSGETDVVKILAKTNELFDSNPGQFNDNKKEVPSDGLSQPEQVVNPKESNDGLVKPEQTVNPKEVEMEVKEEVRENRVDAHPVSEWERDPQGFFTIKPNTEKGEIIAEHHTNDGKISARIIGKSAEDVYHHIIKSNLVSRQDHAAYLGRELAKAEISMLNNLEYEQDSHIKITKANDAQPVNQIAEPERASTLQEPTKPSIPGPVPIRPFGKTEEPEKLEKPGLSMQERVDRLAQSMYNRKEQPKDKEKKGKFLTYYKGYKEIELADGTNPDHEFRALLRDKGMSRIF